MMFSSEHTMTNRRTYSSPYVRVYRFPIQSTTYSVNPKPCRKQPQSPTTSAWPHALRIEAGAGRDNFVSEVSSNPHLEKPGLSRASGLALVVKGGGSSLVFLVCVCVCVCVFLFFPG